MCVCVYVSYESDVNVRLRLSVKPKSVRTTNSNSLLVMTFVELGVGKIVERILARADFAVCHSDEIKSVVFLHGNSHITLSLMFQWGLCLNEDCFRPALSRLITNS